MGVMVLGPASVEGGGEGEVGLKRFDGGGVDIMVICGLRGRNDLFTRSVRCRRVLNSFIN